MISGIKQQLNDNKTTIIYFEIHVDKQQKT